MADDHQTPWPAITALVATLAAWTALQQWWLTREKLRLDLFEKRYAVYKATREFIGAAVQAGDCKQETFFPFWHGTADAAFLFGAEVSEYIAAVNRKGAELHAHYVMTDSAQDPEDRTKHIDRHTENLLWMVAQFEEGGIGTVFKPYLAFQDLEGPLTRAARAAWARWVDWLGCAPVGQARKNEAEG